jgi:N-acetylglucosaminyldiphosphoundecaprenol N-acetyl-beta-D-mannosaminyltransferase
MMIDLGKRNVLGVMIDAVDYGAAVKRIIDAAKNQRPYSVTALAVHGVMTGVGDESHRYRLNHFDMVTPDGQPVRWALNRLHGTNLADRVYGPTLTLKVCAAAADEGLPVFFYGSRLDTLERLTARLRAAFPDLKIAGSEPSKFRRTTAEEKDQIVRRIKDSGARITFVGLGCPRQETFVYEYCRDLRMPSLAVGAAFDYHSGTVSEPGDRVQRLGLQWVHRLMQDPRRLWKRYLLLNPAFVALLLMQWARIWRPRPLEAQPPRQELLYG